MDTEYRVGNIVWARTRDGWGPRGWTPALITRIQSQDYVSVRFTGDGPGYSGIEVNGHVLQEHWTPDVCDEMAKVCKTEHEQTAHVACKSVGGQLGTDELTLEYVKLARFWDSLSWTWNVVGEQVGDRRDKVMSQHVRTLGGDDSRPVGGKELDYSFDLRQV